MVIQDTLKSLANASGGTADEGVADIADVSHDIIEDLFVGNICRWHVEV